MKATTQDTSTEVLLAIDRPNGQLRVSSDVYCGHPFATVRTYWQADDREYKPTKKGVVIKPHELRRVIAALQQIAADIAPPDDEAPASKLPMPSAN